MLNQIFEKYPKPNKSIKEMIAKKLNMNLRCIQIWFQNRRAKAKKDNTINSSIGDDSVLCFNPTSPLEASNYSISGGEEDIDNTSATSTMFCDFYAGTNFIKSDLYSSIQNPTNNSMASTPQNQNVNQFSLSSSTAYSNNSDVSLFSPGLDPLGDVNLFNSGTTEGRLDYFSNKTDLNSFNTFYSNNCEHLLEKNETSDFKYEDYLNV